MALFVALSISIPVMAAASSTPEAGSPASITIVTQVNKVFATLVSRIHHKDPRLVDLFTDSGKTAIFGVVDNDQIVNKFFNNEALYKNLVMTTYDVSDVRVQANGSITALVSYTGLQVPLSNFYVTSQFTLTKSGKSLLIDGQKISASLSFPKGKSVRKIKLKITNDEYSTTASVKTGDFYEIQIQDNSSAKQEIFLIYRLPDGTTYDAALAAGQPLNDIDRVIGYPVAPGELDLAFVGLTKGDYIVVDSALGANWSSGRTAHFIIK